MSEINAEPQPPYYVVVFTSQRTDAEAVEYAEMAEKMMTLAAAQPGYLGVDSVANNDGQSITCSYWQTTADVAAWQANAQHLLAQQQGRDVWYANYRLTVAKVERTYGFERDGG
jgi:heme-degrading monooxygenase HmoA